MLTQAHNYTPHKQASKQQKEDLILWWLSPSGRLDVPKGKIHVCQVFSHGRGKYMSWYTQFLNCLGVLVNV